MADMNEQRPTAGFGHRRRQVVTLGHFGSLEGVVPAATPQPAAALIESLLAGKHHAELS